MGKYIVKRILWLIPITLLVIVFVYTILYFTPGDPARASLGMGASDEAVAAFNAEHGLDLGYFARLFKYLGDLLQGDFGRSYYTKVSVMSEIVTRLPQTVLVALLATAFGLLVGLPMGIVSATHQNTWVDTVTMAVSMFFTSMPSFWFALILVLIFSVNLGWLPSVGYESWKNYVMPVLAIGLSVAATIARQTRSSMLEVIRSDYVTTARAKGQTEKRTISDHVLRNGMIPVVTVAGGIFASLLGGTMIVEQIFSIPGMGMYLFTGISSSDVPIVLGCVIMMSIFHGVMVLIMDLLYVVVDPRLRSVIIKQKLKREKVAHK